MNKITKILVNLSFFLNDSAKYNKIKKLCKRILEDQNYKYGRYFNYFMIFLIISSVGVVIDEVKHPLEHWLVFYDLYIVTIVFIVEYSARFWVYNDIHKIIIEEFQDSLFLEKKFNIFEVAKKIIAKKIEYMLSPLAIIDILAIIPSFREFRILRIFILFRAFKLLRYSSNITHFMKILSSKKSELLMIVFLFLFAIFISGVSIYVFEDHINPHIKTIYDAFYWSLITITSVGYGDIVPVSSEGRSVAAIIVFVGIGLVALATSVIVSAFNENDEELKADKIKGLIDKFSNYYLICGYSHLAELLAVRLKISGDNFIIIDNDPERVEKATKDGYFAYKADASKKNVLLDLQVSQKALAVITLAHDDIQNIFISLSVRSLSKSVMLISRMRHKHSYKKLKLAGVNKIISAVNMSSMLISTLINKPLAIEAINSILSGKKNARCEEIIIYKDSPLAGKKIGEINIDFYKLILLGVSKKYDMIREFIFNPKDDFVLNEGDILVVLGYSISIANFKNVMKKRSIRYARNKR